MNKLIQNTTFAFLFLVLNFPTFAQNSTEIIGKTSNLSKTGASIVLPVTIGIIITISVILFVLYKKKFNKSK